MASCELELERCATDIASCKLVLERNYLPRHRNKLLAEAFYLTGDIEKYGTGFVRLRNWLKDYPGLKYKFSDLNNFFLMELSEKDGDNIAKVPEKGP